MDEDDSEAAAIRGIRGRLHDEGFDPAANRENVKPYIVTDEDRAETKSIRIMRRRLQREFFGITADVFEQTPSLQNLIETRHNTKTYLLTTEWGQAHPSPRNFKISLVKAWPEGEITLPQSHIAWYLQALRQSDPKDSLPEL